MPIDQRAALNQDLFERLAGEKDWESGGEYLVLRRNAKDKAVEYLKGNKVVINPDKIPVAMIVSDGHLDHFEREWMTRLLDNASQIGKSRHIEIVQLEPRRVSLPDDV